jgi:SAM-dependent methyltransferase
VQIAFAEKILEPFASIVRLIQSPMEVNPGLPRNYFDLVFSIYGLGWTTDLRSTMALVHDYLRPGGCLVVSGEHPIYSCLEWNGTQYAISVPYFTEGATEYTSWKGVPIVIQRRTLGSFVKEILQANLQIEALVETPLNSSLATDTHADPARWYSVPRASVMPTTFIVKARKRLDS